MRLRIFILFLFATIFSSCKKSFTCTCSDTGSQEKIFVTTVTGKNANDAFSPCLEFETANTVCIINE